MKIHILLLSFFSILTFMSCEKEEPTKQIFSKISQSFVFEITEGDPNKIDLTVLIDPAQEPNIQPYIGKVLNYKITKISSSVSEYSEENAPNVKLNGIFYDNEPNYMNSVFFYSSDIDLQISSEQRPQNNEFDLPFEKPELDAISELLNKHQKFPIHFKGEVSDAPLYYVLTFNFYINVTVPL